MEAAGFCGVAAEGMMGGAMGELPMEPQLAMRRVGLDDLPAAAPPAGYSVRRFREGDQRAWEEIVGESFGAAAGAYTFAGSVRAKPSYLPERVFFLARGEELVATATALRHGELRDLRGYLHMVAVRPGHQGRRLGYSVSLAALGQMAREGARQAILRTDDFRLAAVKTYLRLGFQPLLVHENQRRRWLVVLAEIGGEGAHPDLAGAIAAGPVYEL